MTYTTAVSVLRQVIQGGDVKNVQNLYVVW